ncbi:MAG: helix-turn-helix domain-containing protein [Thermomicrobiales bacterium]|nr:helix-turn-helix domain-containing protein [Thermomicrobiales bacterium]
MTQIDRSDNQQGGSPRWMTIRDACAFLGVDQSTLRRWTDEGRVPAFLTPGGHRRYLEEDLRSLVAGDAKKPQRSRVNRQRLTDRSLSAYEDDYLNEARGRRWYQSFGAEMQEEHRRLGRRLVDLAIRYAATTGHQRERAQLLIEGREIGDYYGRSGVQAGLGPGEAIEAFLYFRYPTVRAILGVIEEENLPARRAARLFIGIDDFIDQVLLSMMRSYDADRRKAGTVDEASPGGR